MDVLVLNCGSSSAKFAVIDPATSKEEVSGIAQRLGSPEATLDWKRNGTKESRPIAGAGHEMALRAIGTLLNELGLTDELVGIGHRVVHGGSKFSGSMSPERWPIMRPLRGVSPMEVSRDFPPWMQVMEQPFPRWAVTIAWSPAGRPVSRSASRATKRWLVPWKPYRRTPCFSSHSCGTG